MEEKGKGKKYIVLLIVTLILSVGVGLMAHSYWIQKYGEEHYQIPQKQTSKSSKIAANKKEVPDETTILTLFIGAFTQDFSDLKLRTSRGGFNT